LKNVGIGLAGLSLFGCQSQVAVGNKRKKRPNILFIMTDDHAAAAMSCYGSRINKTPNLDRLASEGMLFKNCFCTNSICGPSRATILTGKYSHLHGFMTNENVGFDGSQQTVSKLLHSGGYETAIIGKWHLLSEPTGFDYYKVLHRQGRYFDPQFKVKGSWPKLIEEKGYTTDVITDESIKWLSGRDKEKPFFLMCHHKAPHRHWVNDEKHRKMYDDVHIVEPDNLFDDYEGRSNAPKNAALTIARNFRGGKEDLGKEAPEGLKGKELVRWKYQAYIKRYLGCVASVDDNIGRLMEYLQDSGLADNTVVVYTSDQGFFLGEHGFYDKRFMYEEALRMPLIIRFPGLAQADSVSKKLVANIDFAPTFLDIAGLDVPGDMQGESFRKILAGKSTAEWREAIYYRYYEYPKWHNVEPHYGIRTERYKLIHFYHTMDEWELYDLKNDPREMENLYGRSQYKKLTRRLKDRLYRLQKRYKDTRPEPGKAEKADKEYF